MRNIWGHPRSVIWFDIISFSSQAVEQWRQRAGCLLVEMRERLYLIKNQLVGFLIKFYHVSLSSFMRLMGSHLVSSATNGQKHPVSKSNYYEFIHLEIPIFQKVKNKNGLMSCVEHYHLKLKGLVVLLCKISCTTRWCSKLM